MSEQGIDALGGPKTPEHVPAEWRSLGIIFAFATFYVWWNWGIWADPLIDFGRELYVPWRMAEGEVLGRDLAWFNGPLSQHINALLFAICGESLRNLIALNLAVTGLAFVLLYRTLRYLAGPRSACLGTLSFVTLCAFSQHEGIANFNWLCPYSHEITHGVLLGLVTVHALCAWLTRGQLSRVLVAGLACGLCFLTKPETFLAAIAASGAAFAVGLRTRRSTLWNASSFLAAAAIPVALAWLWLRSISDSENATSLVIGAWKHVGNPELSKLLFYKSSLGLDAPGPRLAILGIACVGWLAIVLAAWAIGRLATKRPQWRAGLAVASAALILILVGAVLGSVPERHFVFDAMFTPLPLAIGLALLLCGKGVFVDGDTKIAARVPILVFGLLLLAKLGIFSRVHHYGFALGMPALAICTALGTEALPRYLVRRGAAIEVTRAILFAVFCSAAILGFRVNNVYRSQKVEFVGDGADRMRAVEGSWRINLILDPLRTSLKEDQTVLVLPEGVTLNYFLRRRTPTRVLNFMPPELIMFGEEEIVRELEANPPDYVIFYTRLTIEYGYPLFGTHYAESIVRWLRANYEVLEKATLGPDPLSLDRVDDRLIGWRVWRRKR